MPSKLLVRWVVGVAVLAFSMLAGAQNWNPGARTRTEVKELENSLTDVRSILYLTQNCKVVAWIVPANADAAQVHLASVEKISRRWFERDDSYKSQSACGATVEFLQWDVSQPGSATDPAKVCDPNMIVDQAELNKGVVCGIKHHEIHSLVALNEDLDPLLVVRGSLAKTVNTNAFPANSLMRKAFTPINPCAPTIPSPCNPPMSGKLKTINGQQVCVCSY